MYAAESLDANSMVMVNRSIDQWSGTVSREQYCYLFLSVT